MTVESEFFYQGINRWNLGLPTPNQAGALLASASCLLWSVWGKRSWSVFGFGAEIGLYYLLCKTYSRGAFVGLVIGAVFYIATLRYGKFVEHWRSWTLRVVIVAASMVGVGFLSRIQPHAMASDDAVSHRLTLWEGGMKMIASSPWHGWGVGESGRAYMNWYQDVDRTEGYVTMVNSYLHVAVEHGAWALGLVVAAAAFMLALAWSGGRRGDFCAAAAGASLACWAVANIFSTLWIEPKLWTVPLLACCVLVWRIRAYLRDQIAMAILLGLGAGALSSIVICSAGRWSLGKGSLHVAPGPSGSVVLSLTNRPAQACNNWEAWIDVAVLGRDPGKEIRRWFVDQTDTNQLRVYTAQLATNARPTDRAKGIMLFGRQGVRLGAIELCNYAHVWIIHPTIPPPVVRVRPNDTGGPLITLILPEVDETGLHAMWGQWAQDSGAQLVVAHGVGTDIRAAWPAVMREDWHVQMIR